MHLYRKERTRNKKDIAILAKIIIIIFFLIIILEWLLLLTWLYHCYFMPHCRMIMTDSCWPAILHVTADVSWILRLIQFWSANEIFHNECLSFDKFIRWLITSQLWLLYIYDSDCRHDYVNNNNNGESMYIIIRI